MLWVIIIVINTLIAAGYFLWGLMQTKDEKTNREKRTKYFLLSFVIFICPLIGVSFLVLSHFMYLFLKKRDVDMADVSFSREKMKNYVSANLEREINVVPVQEALIVSDVRRRRKLLLDVLKRDIRKSLGTISMALSNSDSETSHYAASFIADALSEFRGNVQNMFENLKNDPENYELASLLLEYIDNILKQSILSSDEKRSYTYTLDEIGNIMYRYHPNLMEGWHFRKLIENSVEIGDYSLAERWSKRALKDRNNQLDSYIGCLKFYLACNDRDAFDRCMMKLKESGIVVNKEIMELIRIMEK